MTPPAARVIRALAWLLLRLLPPRKHAVVHGWPDSEPNAVEVLRALTRRYGGRIYWLLDQPSSVVPAYAAAELVNARQVVRVPKRSPRGVLAALTAEVTFFTHGLYTAVTPPNNRLVVNLWHGDGPKATRDPHLVRSTVVVSGSRLWGDYKARLFNLSLQDVAVVGNPRVDQFHEPIPAAGLKRLGLDDDRPVVLWLPTYREARGPRSRAWSDAEHLTRNVEGRDIAQALADEAHVLALHLVIKPHPLDADTYADLGIRVVHAGDLDSAGLSLYQLLGRCAAVVSDISSVWVDFLTLDRPIGFFIPDMAELQARRGLNVDDLENLLPGPRITTGGDARTFLRGVLRHDPNLRPSCYPGYRSVGPAQARPTTEALLNWLDDYQHRRGRRALFAELGGDLRTAASGSGGGALSRLRRGAPDRQEEGRA